MLIIVKILGVVMMIAGLTFLIKPAFMKKLISFMKEAKRIYAIGALRLVFGAIFILAAPQASCSAVIMVIGILLVISSISIFAMGAKRIKAMMEWYLKMPDSNMRLFAIVPVLLGILILYSS